MPKRPYCAECGDVLSSEADYVVISGKGTTARRVHVSCIKGRLTRLRRNAGVRRSSEGVLFSLPFRRGVSRFRTLMLTVSAAAIVFASAPDAVNRLNVGWLRWLRADAVITPEARDIGRLLFVAVFLAATAFLIAAVSDYPRIRELARQTAVQGESALALGRHLTLRWLSNSGVLITLGGQVLLPLGAAIFALWLLWGDRPPWLWH